MATGKPNKWKTDKFLREEPAPLQFSKDGN